MFQKSLLCAALFATLLTSTAPIFAAKSAIEDSDEPSTSTSRAPANVDQRQDIVRDQTSRRRTEPSDSSVQENETNTAHEATQEVLNRTILGAFHQGVDSQRIARARKIFREPTTLDFLQWFYEKNPPKFRAAEEQTTTLDQVQRNKEIRDYLSKKEQQ